MTVFTCFLGIRSGGGGVPKGLVHNLGSSKIEVFETCTVRAIRRYVKHVLGLIYVFHPIWVLGGGLKDCSRQLECACIMKSPITCSVADGVCGCGPWFS